MSPTLISTWPKYLDLNICFTKNCLTNLSTLSHPISQTWELTIPIPHWILTFFHIKKELLITFKVTISEHQTVEIHNTFAVEIIFRWNLNIAFPHSIKELRIVLGYLWPNPYYQIPEEEILHAPSRVSLATGVTASEYSTYTNTPSLPSTLEILPQLEQPVPINHFTAGLRIPSELPPLPLISTYWQVVDNFIHQSPVPILSVEQVLAHIQSGIDLDQPAFREGSIMYQNLQNINRKTHPEFYTNLSDPMDNNYKQPCLEDSEQWGEEEEEEECPLPIPGPSGTHLRIPESEHNSEEQSSKNTRDRLERHLGTIVEETFQERMTLKSL